MCFIFMNCHNIPLQFLFARFIGTRFTFVLIYPVMYSINMPLQILFSGIFIGTQFTFVLFYFLMDSINMLLQIAFFGTLIGTHLTFVLFYHLMNSVNMQLEIMFFGNIHKGKIHICVVS